LLVDGTKGLNRMPSNASAGRKVKSEARPTWRRFLESLGPYPSLALLLLPVGLVEPLKLVAVAVAGTGHWMIGTAVMVVAYAGSLLVVERLFKVLKPKLLTLSWFAWLWTRYLDLRRWAARLLGGTRWLGARSARSPDEALRPASARQEKR
jgi:hypothetical protein